MPFPMKAGVSAEPGRCFRTGLRLQLDECPTQAPVLPREALSQSAQAAARRRLQAHPQCTVASRNCCK